MVKKSIYIILTLFALLSCKKNEENFTLSEDLLTPILSTQDPTIPDFPNPWKGISLLVRTSSEYAATGENITASEQTSKIYNRYMQFAKQNMKHNFSGSEKIEDWVAINNDEIKIESDAFFYNASPTYFEVEITEVPYQGFESIVAELGEEAANNTIDDQFKGLLDVFPGGKIERLRLTMDYNFLSSDKTQRSREFREYHFYRLNPAIGFIFTTSDKYVE